MRCSPWGHRESNTTERVNSNTGLSRQEDWSGLPFPSPGDLPDPGVEPWSLALQAVSLPTEPSGAHGRTKLFQKRLGKNKK